MVALLGEATVTSPEAVEVVEVAANALLGNVSFINNANVYPTGVVGYSELDTVFQKIVYITNVQSLEIYADLGSVEVGAETVVNLTGISASALLGEADVHAGSVVDVVGEQANTQLGSVTAGAKATVFVTTTGLSMTGEVGTVTYEQRKTVFVTGVQAVGSVSSVKTSGWSQIIDDQDPNWKIIDTSLLVAA
jgi:hypothetical protein